MIEASATAFIVDKISIHHALNYYCYCMQLLAKHPYEGYKTMKTHGVCQKLMRTMKANFSSSTMEVYNRNVTLLVRILCMYS